MVSEAQQRHESRRHLTQPMMHRNQVILAHIGLACMVAKRQSLRGTEEFDDLKQESTLGLIAGVENFDHGRGLKPSSYLISRANGQVLHYRRDRATSIRIPWRLRDLYVRGQRLQEQRQKMGLERLSDDDLASSLNVSMDRWQDAVFSQVNTKVLSLDDDELERIDFKRDDNHLEWLRNVLPNLSKNHRALLMAHLVDGMSIKQLALIMQITPTCVRERLRASIKLLKKWAELDGLLLKFQG